MPVTVLNAQRLDSRTLELVIIPRPTKAVDITVQSVRSWANLFEMSGIRMPDSLRLSKGVTTRSR